MVDFATWLYFEKGVKVEELTDSEYEELKAEYEYTNV